MVKKLCTFCLAIILVMGAFTGCGSEKPTSQAAAPSVSGTDSPAKSIVRYTMTSIPKIDPGVGSDMAATTVMVNVYDPLVMPTKDGGIVPWIATEWSVSDDGLTWTFKLRDDVVFHSGNKLTAKDVAYTMNRMIKVGEGFGYLFSGNIQDAVAVDDTTVQFNCSKVNGALLATLVRLYVLDSTLLEANYAAGDYGEFGDYGKTYLLEHDAGSGPYVVNEFIANTHIACGKYPAYWAGFEENTPEEFMLIGSNEAVTVKTMMLRQELEIADKFQSAETVAALAKMEGIKVMPTQSGANFYLLLNNQKAPTDDSHIRKALAYMLDYDAICKNIMPESTQADSIIPSSLLGYKKMHDFSFNMEKAKEEIALSKYADNIKDFPIEVCWVAETPDREKLALLIQAAGTQLGMNIKVVKTPWTSVVENSAKQETTPNVTTTLWSANYSEAGAVMEASLRSKKVGTWSNCCWINDPKLDEMIDGAMVTLDTDARVQKYMEIQDYLVDKCVLIPVTETTERMGYQASYMEWNAAEQDQLIPVMGYVYYMRNIKIFPEKRK